VEGSARESKRETLNPGMLARVKRSNRAGIEAAREKKADRHVSNKMGADGGSEVGWPSHGACGGAAFGVPPRMRARDSAAIGDIEKHAMAGRQGEYSFEHGDGLAHAAEKKK